MAAPNNDIVLEKAFQFAVNVTDLVLQMQDWREYVISRQLLKSATSIWANIEEAKLSQWLKDFNSKMHIAKKESREAHFWLRLISFSRLWSMYNVEKLLSDCEEIRRILIKITQTTTQKLRQKSVP